MALTAAPAFSHIYVFTDATAKDIALKDTISALISSTKSTVRLPPPHTHNPLTHLLYVVRPGT